MLRTGCFTVVEPLGGFTTFELRGFPRFVVGRGFAAAGVEDMMWGRGCRGRAELTESRLVEHLATGEKKLSIVKTKQFQMQTRPYFDFRTIFSNHDFASEFLENLRSGFRTKNH